MVIAISVVLVIVCVGAYLVLYARRTKRPEGWTREDRRRAMSKLTPENLEADYQEQRCKEGGPRA